MPEQIRFREFVGADGNVFKMRDWRSEPLTVEAAVSEAPILNEVMPLDKPMPANVVKLPIEPLNTDIPWTMQQLEIFRCMRQDTCHIIVEALAGTGKTTTGVEGIRYLPSGLSVGYMAFNKSIANELKARSDGRFQASTFNSFGNGLLFQRGRFQVKSNKTRLMLPREMASETKTAIAKLVSLCKGRLLTGRPDELSELLERYRIDVGDYPRDVYDWVPRILERSQDDRRPGFIIDYDDQIWLPIVWNLHVNPFDVLIVDESQDQNPAQQELMFRAGKRLMFVGDRYQAIYGFRGADTEAMDNLEQRLMTTARSVKILPLTISQRCPKVVAQFAAAIVPQFQAREDAPEGTLCFSCADGRPERGHMVISRTNAPLIPLAYRLLRAGVSVKIQGKDLGEDLVATIRRLVAEDATAVELVTEVAEYRSDETAKIVAANLDDPDKADELLEQLNDRCDCLTALCDGMATVQEVIGRVLSLFADVEKGDTSNYVLLTSGHRAKGLEARTVWVINPELFPHPMARAPWARVQEMNLKYVSQTRSQDTLHWHPPVAA